MAPSVISPCLSQPKQKLDLGPMTLENVLLLLSVLRWRRKRSELGFTSDFVQMILLPT